MASKAERDLTPTSVTGRSSRATDPRTPLPRRFDAAAPGLGRPAAGFSLLEVLVVVFIVGVLATMFTLSVGVVGGDRQLEKEVDRLIAVIDLAREEAVIQGREIGMRFNTAGYQFSAYVEDFVDYPDEDTPDQSEWVLLDKATLLGPRELPEGLRFELQIDGRDVVLADEVDAVPAPPTETAEEEDPDARPDTFQPQVMIYSSGDMSPFTLELRRTFANTGKIIEFDIDGSVEVEDESR